MIQINVPNGVYWKLQKDKSRNDFRGNYKEFLAAVRKLNSYIDVPEQEIDELLKKNPRFIRVAKTGEHFFFIGRPDFERFVSLKKRYLDDVIECENQMKEAGFKPIPTVNHKFARSRLRY